MEGSAGRARPVLVTVSGAIDPAIEERIAVGERPRADYLEMARAFDADLVDYAEARRTSGRTGRLIERAGGPNLLLAWWCFRRRRRYDVVFTDGEQAGLPYAVLCRVLGRGRARHLMIVHILSVPKKARMIRWLHLAPMIDRYFVYATAQRRFVVDHLGVPADRVVLTPFMVDTAFFSPSAISAVARRMICSAGLERRDYATLIEAIGDLNDVEVVIAAASPWSRQQDASRDRPLPANVTIRRLDLAELRQLYAEASVVVMPLLDVDFQAGITTILEAMAMAKPIVCTRTPGQTDVIVDGVNGLYVPPGDAAALREAILRLLDDPALAERLGQRARADVVERADIEVYVDGLARHVVAASR